MATCGREAGPYAAAIGLTAEPKAELLEPRPAAAHPSWIPPLSCYDRREIHEFQVSRYG
jgi:hypothetical protein